MSVINSVQKGNHYIQKGNREGCAYPISFLIKINMLCELQIKSRRDGILVKNSHQMMTTVP